MRALIASLALILSAPALAEESPAWRPVDAETGQIADVDGLEQLAQDFPDSGSVQLRLLRSYLTAGDTDKALVTLQWLFDRGYVFGEGAQAQIPQLLADVPASSVEAVLHKSPVVIEASEVVASVVDEAGLVESAKVVMGGRGIAVSSITVNALYFSAPEDNWVTLALPNASDLSGIVEDRARKTLWVASSNLDNSEDETVLFSGLIGVRQGGATTYVAAPEGGNPSDLAIGDDGTIYASDPIKGSVFMAKPGEAQMSVLVEPGHFRSPQGLVVSEDGQHLYVSDYRYGIALIDLESGDIRRVTTELPILLDGIDGMWRYRDELIAVQNGTNPIRISAFKLSQDGTSIVGHRILEQAHSGWTEPLGGSIAGDALVYVATGQWDVYAAGKVADGKQPRETEIRQLRLN